MKRLVFIVEGNTEVILVNKFIIPFLFKKGFSNQMNAQTIITNRKQHKKGGVINYEYYKNDIQRVLSQGNVLITSFIDFFRLPTNFPNYSSDINQIEFIELGILEDFNNNPNVFPYIQKHELEALMFSNLTGFELLSDNETEMEKLKKIIDEYPNPENINTSPEKAPSKRLEKIINYEKVADSEIIFEIIEIENIIEKCPRFKSWIEKIIFKLEESNRGYL